MNGFLWFVGGLWVGSAFTVVAIAIFRSGNSSEREDVR